MFGANYLSFGIRPSPDGGLTQGTTAELRLKDRGLFQFVSLLEKSRERAIYMKRQAESDEDTLREFLIPLVWMISLLISTVALYDSRSADRTPEPTMASSSRMPLDNIPADLPPGYDA